MTKKTSLPRWAYITLSLCSFAFVAYFTSLFMQNRQSLNSDSFFFILIAYGSFSAAFVFSITEIIADVKGEMLGFVIRAGGPFAAMLIIIIFGIYFKQNEKSQHDLSIQLHGPLGLSDIPNYPSSLQLTLIPPSHLERFTREANSAGQVKFDLSSEYFQTDVRFSLKPNHMELIAVDSIYNLSTNEELKIAIRPKKALFTFTIRDSETRKGIEGVRLVVPEFDLDTLTNKFGKVVFPADTSNLEVYHYSLTHPSYQKSKKEDFLIIKELKPFFYLEPYR